MDNQLTQMFVGFFENTFFNNFSKPVFLSDVICDAVLMFLFCVHHIPDLCKSLLHLETLHPLLQSCLYFMNAISIISVFIKQEACFKVLSTRYYLSTD